VGISERRKSRVEAPPIVSKSRRAQGRPVEAAVPHGHPFRVKTANFPRRRFLHLAAGAAALPAVTRIARAQTYPTRPVRLIVGFPPGGAGDITARLMGQWLSERLGQQFIIENRPGAGSNIGTEAVVRAAPDGYTLLVASSANAINATLYDKLKFKFYPRHYAGRRHHPRTASHGGQFIVFGQDGPRVHRLRQGQSGQDQHGVGGYRNWDPCSWRAVQDDDWRQDSPRTLSRRRTRAYRSSRRTGASDVRHDGLVNQVHQGRRAARAGGDRRNALGRTAGRPGCGRFRARLRDERLVRSRVPMNTPADIISKLNKETNAALASTSSQ
jgi:hypothetical protein